MRTIDSQGREVLTAGALNVLPVAEALKDLRAWQRQRSRAIAGARKGPAAN